MAPNRCPALTGNTVAGKLKIRHVSTSAGPQLDCRPWRMIPLRRNRQLRLLRNTRHGLRDMKAGYVRPVGEKPDYPGSSSIRPSVIRSLSWPSSAGVRSFYRNRRVAYILTLPESSDRHWQDTLLSLFSGFSPCRCAISKLVPLGSSMHYRIFVRVQSLLVSSFIWEQPCVSR
jgi:hypothetical protein